MEVSGTIVNFNRGAAFFYFRRDGEAGCGAEGGGTEEVCMFRPNRLHVDGQKIPASKIKTVEAVGKVGEIN